MTGIENIIRDLEQQRANVERALAALREIAGMSSAVATVAKRRGRPPGRTNQAAPAASNKRSEGQQRRWAEKRAAEAGGVKKQRGGKRTISPEGRARIAEAARRMWAAKKTAGTKKRK